MYDVVEDPYCYPGTTVLKNIPGIRDQTALDEFEAAITAQRADEPLPAVRLGAAHYKAIHHHLFQNVYAWASKFRTVRISKDGSAFCYPENIEREMKSLLKSLRDKRYLWNLSRDRFADEAARLLSTLNAVRPFRGGNGRTQTKFLALLANRARHPLDLDNVRPAPFLEAMVASFKGDDGSLERHIFALTGT